MPDIPDRIMEIDAQGNPVRVLSRGSTVYEGMRVEKVRSWFVGPDGLTEPEREAARLAGRWGMGKPAITHCAQCGQETPLSRAASRRKPRDEIERLREELRIVKDALLAIDSRFNTT